jgi:hypothetical protein
MIGKKYDLIFLDWTPSTSPNALIPCTRKRRLHSDILFLFLCVDADFSYSTTNVTTRICLSEINQLVRGYSI